MTDSPKRIVEMVERRASKRPTEIAGLSWHLPDHQARICVNCRAVALEGSGPLHEGKWCGRCWLATDPPHAA